MSDSGEKPEVNVNEGNDEIPEHLQDRDLFNDRSCTDICMIFVALIFILIWIVILTLAAQNGKPERLLMPENFRGDLCGDLPPLVDYKNGWVPKPSRLSYVLCVMRCPAVGDYVCNNDVELAIHNSTLGMQPNHIYTHTSTEYDTGRRAMFKCMFSCDAAERDLADRYIALQVKLKQYKCFLNWYTSGATLFRCLPFQDERDNMTLADLAGESASTLQKVADKIGVGAFFQRGFAEVEQSWLVILLSCISCLVISFIWIFLLRCLIGPIVFLCIFLIFALLVLIGYFAMLMADDLEKVKLPGDTATDNQVKMWRAIQWGAWILAAVYVVVMLWMAKRIRIAIQVMKEGSYAVLETPSMIIVPPVVFILVIGWIAFFIVSTIYIQTIGDVSDEAFKDAAVSAFGEQAVNLTLAIANTSSNFLKDQNITNENSTVNTSQFDTDERIKILHAYNFFGFLWMSNFCIMYGFFIIALCCCQYYYSATQTDMRLAEDNDPEVAKSGKVKGTPFLAVGRAFLIVLRYHLGTTLWGSLLIAIIQFVRALFLYLEEEFLNEWAETCSMQFLLRCIDCCLWYIEKVIRIISQNAFIVCCILITPFCESAGTVMSLMINNAARVSVLIFLSTVTMFVLKLFIVFCNMIAAWAMINVEALTQDRPVESGLFPMIGILIISFVIASLFINVYESAVDSILMCFLVDEDKMGGNFMPEGLADLCGMFKSTEEAKRAYELKVRETGGVETNERTKAKWEAEKKAKEDSEPK